MRANAGTVIDCRDVFDSLYRPALRQASEARVIAFEETDDFILRSGIADLVVNHAVRYFEQLVGRKVVANIYRDNLKPGGTASRAAAPACTVCAGDRSTACPAGTASARTAW
jgi:hypothetical protein